MFIVQATAFYSLRSNKTLKNKILLTLTGRALNFHLRELIYSKFCKNVLLFTVFSAKILLLCVSCLAKKTIL